MKHFGLSQTYSFLKEPVTSCHTHINSYTNAPSSIQQS